MKISKIYKLIAAVGKKAASRASGTASGFGTYQPVELESLKSFKK
ncbi:MAG: cyclic lactone autoinducer peptide [Ruminococcus sp.]|nr:cyclic lactone autoinducer peptide [Ruminococcus sp.]